MRGKKKKGRVLKPGDEATNAVAASLIGKLQAAGVKVDENAMKADDANSSSIMDQSAWTYYSESTNVDTQAEPGAQIGAADFSLKAELEELEVYEGDR